MPRWNTVEARERNHVGERHPSPCLSVEVTTCFSGGRRHTISKALALFGVPRDRIALEPDSETTRANAENTARLLKERGIETTVLVTSALHMRRAAAEFERAGVHVIWAPVDHTVRPLGGLDTLFPDAGSLSRLDEILHELVGRFKP